MSKALLENVYGGLEMSKSSPWLQNLMVKYGVDRIIEVGGISNQIFSIPFQLGI